jgi:hypothetical protein
MFYLLLALHVLSITSASTAQITVSHHHDRKDRTMTASNYSPLDLTALAADNTATRRAESQENSRYLRLPDTPTSTGPFKENQIMDRDEVLTPEQEEAQKEFLAKIAPDHTGGGQQVHVPAPAQPGQGRGPMNESLKSVWLFVPVCWREPFQPDVSVFRTQEAGLQYVREWWEKRYGEESRPPVDDVIADLRRCGYCPLPEIKHDLELYERHLKDEQPRNTLDRP